MSYRSKEDKEVSTCCKLIPEIAHIHVRSQGQEDEIITKGSKIQIEDLWTTEALIDRLKSFIIHVKDENQEQPQSSFRYDRKYLNKAVELIENWSKIEQASPPQSHVFIFHLSDLLRSDRRLLAELVELSNTPSTIDDVFHRVLEWLFSMVSAGWFYQSAAEDVQVRFDA